MIVKGKKGRGRPKMRWKIKSGRGARFDLAVRPMRVLAPRPKITLVNSRL